MKIRKEPIDKQLIKKLHKENERLSIEELAIKYGTSRNVMGEILRLHIATQTSVDRITEKMQEYELTA